MDEPLVSESAAMPIVVVLFLLTYGLIRTREADWWVVVIIFLLGFYTAFTPVADFIDQGVAWLTGWW
jgi:RsiW-degrading membrane proteinase PrsW (M82 family)